MRANGITNLARLSAARLANSFHDDVRRWQPPALSETA